MWSAALKREIVAVAAAPGASVSIVARRYDVNTNLVFTWRKLYGARAAPALTPHLVPVMVTSDQPTTRPTTPPADMIEIELPAPACGSAQVSRPQPCGWCWMFWRAMIAFPSSVRVWLAVGRTDMRRGMNGLALQVQQALGRDPHAGDMYVFRGARGDLLKILWHDGIGMSLYAKR